MKNPFEIRRVSPDEITALQAISRQTFEETFAADNEAGNLQQYMEEQLSAARLEQEMLQPGSEFYFAADDAELLGYLKVNYGNAQTELQDPEALEIERIYVLKQFQGQHAGKRLFEHAVSLARQRKAAYVWLGVWEKNLRAIEFYQRQGFAAFGQHIFRLGNDEQTDLMMKLDLTYPSKFHV